MWGEVIAKGGLNGREPVKLTSLPDIDTYAEGELLAVSPVPIYQVLADDGSVVAWVSAQFIREYQGEVQKEEPAMIGPAVVGQEPPWLPIARGEIGVREIAGPEDNPRIQEYHASTSLKATDDETPWCSAFVNWCLQQAGLEGTGSAMARSWLDWGQKVTEPQPGDVAVFARGTGNQGHVGFCLGRSGGSVKLLGGNQNDEVNVAWQNASRLLGYRRPI
jgi:uncharacterized protein (TIGR02594 family)